MIKRYATWVIAAALFTACGATSGEGDSGNTGSEGNETPTTDTITTASGLKYVITQQGGDEKAEVGNLVTVHYTGTLKASGQKFDSSLDRGEPIKFRVGTGQVIPGWDEGIMALSKGTKATLIIPSNLAYGPQERPGIPANSDLLFDVEIIDFEEITGHEVYDVEGLEKQTTDSGLEYYIVEEGTGAQAQAGGQVQVHYYGYFKETGERFDDSFSRGQPFPFTLGVGQVIPGWDEGISLLKEGSKAKLMIPYELAYGESGRGPIPAKADLVFDVYLVKVN